MLLPITRAILTFWIFFVRTTLWPRKQSYHYWSKQKCFMLYSSVCLCSTPHVPLSLNYITVGDLSTSVLRRPSGALAAAIVLLISANCTTSLSYTTNMIAAFLPGCHCGSTLCSNKADSFTLSVCRLAVILRLCFAQRTNDLHLLYSQLVLWL